MAIMTVINPDDDMPELHCPECDVVFSVVFHRNPIYGGIEYCPFCGEDVDGFVNEAEDE